MQVVVKGNAEGNRQKYEQGDGQPRKDTVAERPCITVGLPHQPTRCNHRVADTQARTAAQCQRVHPEQRSAGEAHPIDRQFHHERAYQGALHERRDIRTTDEAGIPDAPHHRTRLVTELERHAAQDQR